MFRWLRSVKQKRVISFCPKMCERFVLRSFFCTESNTIRTSIYFSIVYYVFLRWKEWWSYLRIEHNSKMELKTEYQWKEAVCEREGEGKSERRAHIFMTLCKCMTLNSLINWTLDYFHFDFSTGRRCRWRKKRTLCLLLFNCRHFNRKMIEVAYQLAKR